MTNYNGDSVTTLDEINALIEASQTFSPSQPLPWVLLGGAAACLWMSK